jgi:hypothetical protein
MSDTGRPAGGGEQFVPAPAREMSEAQVTEAIEGLLDDRPPPRPRQQPQRQQNQPQAASDVPVETEEPGPDPRPGPEDPAPSEEEDDYTPDPEDVPEGDDLADHQSVEPPTSWSNQDKEVFRSLPPEAQAVIARRESEQNKAFTQKTQEIAEHRRALESTFQEIQGERDAYARNLQQLLYVAAPEAEKFAAIDWTRLAQEQPAEYVRLTAERDALRGRIGGIQGELQRVAAQAQQAQAQQFAQLRQVEQRRLIEALPDFGDRDKGPKKVAEMRAWLNGHGFSDQEIGQVVDHRVLLVVDAAMQADRTREARRQAETKRNGAAPQVQPPGNSRQRGDTGAAVRRGQKMAALKKSGSEKDAISYLLEVL